jgi:hypothetical protein
LDFGVLKERRGGRGNDSGGRDGSASEMEIETVVGVLVDWDLGGYGYRGIEGSGSVAMDMSKSPPEFR